MVHLMQIFSIEATKGPMTCHVEQTSGGRRVSQTCMIRGREAEGRKAILKRGRKHTRVAEIHDGLTTDANDKVLTSDIMDIKPADTRVAVSVGPVAAIVGERGTITLPAGIRRRRRLQPGSPFLIEERGDETALRLRKSSPDGVRLSMKC